MLLARNIAEFLILSSAPPVLSDPSLGSAAVARSEITSSQSQPAWPLNAPTSSSKLALKLTGWADNSTVGTLERHAPAVAQSLDRLFAFHRTDLL